MCFTRNRGRGKSSLTALVLLILGVSARAREPLVPHRIKDMILVGREGTSKSTVSRRVFMLGDFMYVSGEPGLQTIDASDPASLRLTDDWTQSSAKVNGSASKDGVLYVGNWSPGAGLVLFDLVDPAHPAHLKTISTSAHTWELEIHEDFLHVGIDDGLTTGIVTYDIADPRSPELVSFLSMGDRLVGNAARRGDLLYVNHKNWLRIYDFRDPYSPQLVRELALDALGVEARVWGDHLFVLCRYVLEGDVGGLHVYSLADPARPAQVSFWEQFEPRDLHFQGNLLVVPASGSGIYTLDVEDPAHPREIHHWYVTWPGAGEHGGYPVTATGSRNHVYIGTTGGNNPECEDFETCPYYGARVYSIQVSTEPPIPAPVSPDPDAAVVGRQYVKALSLLEGDPAPSWSVVRGPPGLQVDASGLVRGWTPALADAGKTYALEVRAANPDGSARTAWTVQVVPPPADEMAFFDFEGGAQGWAASEWKSGPYDPGSASWQAAGGSLGGHLFASGSGATNNQDTCNREGGILTRAISTEGWGGLRVEYDCLAELDQPPGASGAGSCPVLEGTSEDKLVVYCSTSGTGGPWRKVQALSEGDGLPESWSRQSADLSAVPGAGENPSFALRFQWQFNTASDSGRIDNIQVRGVRIPAAGSYRRGDSNGDGVVDLSDGIRTLGFLFLGQEGPPCFDAADANDSGDVDISDAVYTFSFLFLGGPRPPLPFPDCDVDGTPDVLGCESYLGCT